MKKSLFITVGALVVTFGAYTRSTAQSIVGKWERTSMKITAIDKSGKVLPDKSEELTNAWDGVSKMIKVSLEFKADKTYDYSVTTSGLAGKQTLGKYTLNGNQLKLDKTGGAVSLGVETRMQGGLPDKATVQSVNGNTMVWRSEMPGEDYKSVELTTFKKQ